MTPLQQLLMHQEGTGPMKRGRYLPYDDATGKVLLPGDTLIGNLTIGTGRNLSGIGISDEERMMLLSSDLADAIADARRLFSCYDALSETRKMVLVSLAFNLGRDRLGAFVRFIGAVHRGDWDDAADEILDSKAAKTQAAPRYRELADMMRTDVSVWV